MNAITKALDEIKFTIPYEILQIAFVDNISNWRQAPISLDERIHNEVLRSRVLVDADLVGGMQVVIPIENMHPVYAVDGHIVYQIPKRMTDNRSIIAVLSLLGITSTQYSFMGQSGIADNELSAAGARVGAAASSEGPAQSAKLELIGENTVLIKYHWLPYGIGALRVILGNDENLTNISIRSYHSFAQLCILAVKSYIYNKLFVQLDKGYLYGGHELGAIKEYVDNLSDAEEMYQTYLREKWRKTSFMNDEETHHRWLKSMINPAL
jgi:hypothetical protein